MRYRFVVLIASLLFGILSTQADNLQTTSALKYRKVIDIQTGAIDTEFCSRDCPKYPGGEEALTKYIYTQLGITSNISKNQNPTIVKFLITNNGKVRDVSIEKTSNEQYDREILKVIQSLSNFFPNKEPNTCYYAWMSIYLPQ